MEQQTVYDRIRNRTTPETRHYVKKNMAVVAEISRLMKEKGWTQKELAKKLGKTDSEVSKWLSGLHNLTLKSIAKLETVLEAPLLEVPKNEILQSKSVHYAVFRVEKPFQNRPIKHWQADETAVFEKSDSQLIPMVA